MAVLEPQLRKKLEKALAEINDGLAASTRSRDLVEELLGSAGEAKQPATVGTDTFYDLAMKGSTLTHDPTFGMSNFSQGESGGFLYVPGWCGSMFFLNPSSNGFCSNF